MLTPTIDSASLRNGGDLCTWGDVVTNGRLVVTSDSGIQTNVPRSVELLNNGRIFSKVGDSMPSYRYLLPVFVGHPFRADYTPELRQALNAVCTDLTETQATGAEQHLWQADFANKISDTEFKTILRKVRSKILHSALAVFEVSDSTNANVFLELGMALGMGRRVVLVCRKPFDVPADIRGYEGIEYEDTEELERKVRDVFVQRYRELRNTPNDDVDVVFQKIQIDSCWVNYIRRAESEIYFFSGDVSWVNQHEEHLEYAREKDTRLQVCCRLPRRDEDRKWANIEKLIQFGAEVRLFESEHDPEVRGFITNPARVWKSHAVFVERHDRYNDRYDEEADHTTPPPPSESDGHPNSELDYLYKAQVFRGKQQPDLVSAMIRLFQLLWESSSLHDYSPELRGSLRAGS